MAWIRCSGCGDWFCTIHLDHAADCECPEIQDWETDSYESN